MRAKEKAPILKIKLLKLIRIILNYLQLLRINDFKSRRNRYWWDEKKNPLLYLVKETLYHEDNDLKFLEIYHTQYSRYVTTSVFNVSIVTPLREIMSEKSSKSSERGWIFSLFLYLSITPFIWFFGILMQWFAVRLSPLVSVDPERWNLDWLLGALLVSIVLFLTSRSTRWIRFSPFYLSVPTLIRQVDEMHNLLKENVGNRLEQNHDLSKEMSKKIMELSSSLEHIPVSSAAQSRDFFIQQAEEIYVGAKELYDLATAGMTNIADETREASLDIMEKLTQIQQSIKDLQETLSSMRQRSEELAESSNATMAENDDTIKKLQEYIARRLKEVEEEYQVSCELSQYIKLMSNMLKLVKGVSDRTNMLALNATIEAAKVGEMGKGFAVVANEVRNLSSQSEQSTKKIEDAIGKMSGTIEKGIIQKHNPELQKKETELLEQLKSQLIHIVESYHNLDELNRNSLEEIEQSSQAITKKVLAAIASNQFQDITQQQIEVILKGISFFNDFIKNSIAGSKDPEKPDGELLVFDPESIRSLYVMKKQHVIHDDTLGPSPDSDTEVEEEHDDNITFF